MDGAPPVAGQPVNCDPERDSGDMPGMPSASGTMDMGVAPAKAGYLTGATATARRLFDRNEEDGH